MPLPLGRIGSRSAAFAEHNRIQESCIAVSSTASSTNIQQGHTAEADSIRAIDAVFIPDPRRLGISPPEIEGEPIFIPDRRRMGVSPSEIEDGFGWVAGDERDFPIHGEGQEHTSHSEPKQVCGGGKLALIAALGAIDGITSVSISSLATVGILGSGLHSIKGATAREGVFTLAGAALQAGECGDRGNVNAHTQRSGS